MLNEFSPSLPPPQACALDPMLDDSVMMAKRLRNVGQPVTLCVVDELPHGFLSLSQLSRETREAANVCVGRIREILDAKDTPPPAHRKLERTNRGSVATGDPAPLSAVPVEEVGLAVGGGAKVAEGEGPVGVATRNKTGSEGIGA